MDFRILLMIFIGPNLISTETIMHKFDIHLGKAFANPKGFQMKNTGIQYSHFHVSKSSRLSSINLWHYKNWLSFCKDVCLGKMETSTALGNATQMPSVQGLLWRGEIVDKIWGCLINKKYVLLIQVWFQPRTVFMCSSSKLHPKFEK